jgi:hypothetical protein
MTDKFSIIDYFRGPLYYKIGVFLMFSAAAFIMVSVKYIPAQIVWFGPVGATLTTWAGFAIVIFGLVVANVGLQNKAGN